MGLNVSANMRVAHLTGSVLRKAMDAFANTSAYQHGQVYLTAKGIHTTAPVDSGMDIFTESGGAWSTTEILVRDFGNARLISVNDPHTVSTGMLISDGAGRFELIDLSASGSKSVGVITRKNGALTVEVEGHAPYSIAHS